MVLIRQVGRPETNPAYRVAAKAWFIAVSQASGMNASQLEVFFADPSKKLEYRKGNRPGLWNKYQRGTACPNINDRSPDKPSLPNLVERRFPGTKQWLTTPLWRLLTWDAYEIEDLKSIFLSLSADVRDLVIHSTYRPGKIFWRVQAAPEEIYAGLVSIGTIDAAIAVLALIKEAEATQSQHQHVSGLIAWAQCVPKLSGHPVIGTLVDELDSFIDHRFRHTEYFGPGNPSESYCLRLPDILSAWKEYERERLGDTTTNSTAPQKSVWEIGTEMGKGLVRAARKRK